MFYCARQGVNCDSAEDDGGPARHVEPEGEGQSGEAGEEAEEGGEPDHGAVAADEEGGRELGHAEEADDHDDADDVLQNVFVKAWSNMDDFQNRSKISTWLYRIAVNESLDLIRRKKDIASLGDEANVAVANRLMSDDYFDGDRAQALLQAAIASLPDVQRVVFNLRYYDEMKYSDISRLLNTSEGALKASYHIAVKKITAFVKSHE